MADLSKLKVNGTTYDLKDAKGRSDISDLKEDLFDYTVKGKTEKSVSSSFVELSEDNVSDVAFYTEDEAHVYGVNRFNIATASITHDGYSSTVITKTATGIKIEYPGGGTNKNASTTYTAEFDGNLYISCNASTTGNIRDLRMNVKKNGTLCAQCYGMGLLKQRISVSVGDTVEIRFLMRAGENIPNTVFYEDIMVSYIDSEYVAFNDYTNEVTAPDYTLPHGSSDWVASSTAPDVSGINVYLSDTAKASMPSGLPLPSSLYEIPSGLTVDGLDLVTYSSIYNGVEGLGVSTSGKIMLYVSGCSTTQDYTDWLAAHTVTLSYTGTTTVIPFDGSSREFRTGESIEFADDVDVTYYYKNEPTPTKKKMVCFGDSCTGMFGYATDYPSMITESADIEAINCGFSGSCWTDYPNNTTLMPFSINRLIDSIVAEDFSLQDNVIGSVTVDWFAEHLANLEAVDWDEITYVTFFAGVNDWYYSANKLYSADDTSTTNKQRTNVQDCVTYCITQLLTKYPHLKIVVLTPYHAYMVNVDSDTTPNSNGDYLYEYAEVIAECTHGKNMPCIEQYRTSGVNQITMYYYTSDGTHPNEPMKHMIADRIVKAVDTITA